MTDSADRLETLWEKLAQAIDTAGREHETLFLSKLALLFGNELANELGNAARVDQLIAEALRDLR